MKKCIFGLFAIVLVAIASIYLAEKTSCNSSNVVPGLARSLDVELWQDFNSAPDEQKWEIGYKMTLYLNGELAKRDCLTLSEVDIYFSGKRCDVYRSNREYFLLDRDGGGYIIKVEHAGGCARRFSYVVYDQ